MCAHEPVKWISPEGNIKIKVSGHEEDIKNRKKMNLCNYYEYFNNNNSKIKEELEDDATQVDNNQKSSKVKEDKSECSVVTKEA